MTHVIKLPPALYDQIDQGLSMLHTSNFDDMVTEGDFVRVEDPGGRVFVARVTGFAAVIEKVEGQSDSHVCPTCHGDGGDLDDSSKPCDECNGAGRIDACAHEGCPRPRGYISIYCSAHELVRSD